MRIRLVAYDPAWAVRFNIEKDRIRGALGSRAVRIEHIGSTAIAGLAAKPVVDILVAVKDTKDDAIASALRRSGYNLIVDEEKHRMFRTVDAGVHVHLWEVDSEDVRRHIVFRDWLRQHSSERHVYEGEKRRLASREWRTQNDYAEAKSSVIEQIFQRAQGGQH